MAIASQSVCGLLCVHSEAVGCDSSAPGWLLLLLLQASRTAEKRLKKVGHGERRRGVLRACLAAPLTSSLCFSTVARRSGSPTAEREFR